MNHVGNGWIRAVTHLQISDLMNHVGNGWIRAVTHLQISDPDIHDAVLRIREVVSGS
jgi:hypothetical protein